MKILFVSRLTPTASAGPNWSVPARVLAQSKIDDVFWINAIKSNERMSHWVETGLYHNLNDISGKLSLQTLPIRFKRPDVVVFEVPYFIEYLSFAKQLKKEGIPYIISPRCSFTHQAMNNHAKWKKKIAGWLMFNSFFRGARAIHYLTDKELQDSSPFICPNGFIVPNGINLPKLITHDKSVHIDGFKGVFIGRIDIYHKGLDLLVEGAYEIRDYLRENKVKIEIYGPESEDSNKLQQIIENHDVSDICELKGEVSGAAKDSVLRNADFFIMTSRFEGQPMAMLEAMSYGIPCIASEGSYMRKIVDDNDAGYGCGNQVRDISEVLAKLINNKNLLPTKGINARKLAEAYTWDKQALLFHKEISKFV